MLLSSSKEGGAPWINFTASTRLTPAFTQRVSKVSQMFNVQLPSISWERFLTGALWYFTISRQTALPHWYKILQGSIFLGSQYVFMGTLSYIIIVVHSPPLFWTLLGIWNSHIKSFARQLLLVSQVWYFLQNCMKKRCVSKQKVQKYDIFFNSPKII